MTLFRKVNKARATLESLGAQDTSRTFKEFKGFYKIPTAQVPGRPKIPKDSKEFKRIPKNSKGLERISTAQVPGRPTDSKGF